MKENGEGGKPQRAMKKEKRDRTKSKNRKATSNKSNSKSNKGKIRADLQIFFLFSCRQLPDKRGPPCPPPEKEK